MNSSPALTRLLEPVAPTLASDSPAMDEVASSLRASNSASPKLATPASATPHMTIDARPTSALSVVASAPGSVPRLRSSIACVKCRKSKIKCTNSGTGTTCEACAHSGRECVYPVSGSGGAKRDGDGEDSDRAKRTRVRRPDPIQDAAKMGFFPKYPSLDYARVRFGSDKDSSQSSGRSNFWQPSALSESMWNEVFQLFQLHYGTELAFLHAPTFLPFLTESSASDPLSQHLLQLGILALTARHHDGLIYQFSSQMSNGSVPLRAPDIVCEHFAHMLKGLLLGGERVSAPACIEEPTLAKIQAFLMLSLYEWSSRRGMQAWLYLGIAIRMAQAMDLFSEDLDLPDTISNPLTGSLISMLSKVTLHSQRQDLENSETFVQEETARRTVWSCFLLDRYLSNGASRSSSLDADKVHVQMPCGEKGWTFGERACTPFFNGNCSQQKDRTKRRLEHTKKQIDDKGAIDPRVVHAGAESSTNRITCEYGQDEGLISRYIKLVDIWGAIARWSYDGGSRASGSHTPWDDRSKYWTLKGELQKFMDQMPRSYRFTKANSQAHLTQHTWSSYTLLHALYSICRLVLLREFLPFVPIKVRSTTHLDEIEVRDPNVYNRTWYSGALTELFQVTHDLMDLLQTCKTRSSLPAGPMIGFGVYLVSLIGIYTLYFPHMDNKGLVFGKDLETQTAVERQNRIIETVGILASMQTHLPMAEHWFGTLHRAHRYYQQLYNSQPPELRFGPTGIYSLPSMENGTNRPWHTRLDAIFQEFGAHEDENLVFTLPAPEALLPPTNGTAEHLPSPQYAWKPINSGQRVGRCIDPLDRPAPQLGPQAHAKWYQARGEPVRIDQSPVTTESNGTSYSAAPPNTLPPITAPSMNMHSSPSYPSTTAKQQSPSPTLLSFSGEDVAIFIDAKTNKDLAALKSGWAMLADDKDPTTNIGSPSLRAQEIKKMEAFGVSWFGVLWQW